MFRIAARALVCALALSTPLAAAALPSAADYTRLQKWQFASAPTPLTQPVTFTRDGATWTLESGNVFLMQPLEGGRITGLVFEGKGTFQLAVPDPVELAQLRRFSGKKELTELRQPFTQLVFRTSDDAINKLFQTAPQSFANNGIAEKRHNSWYIDQRTDVDAEIVSAIANAPVNGLYTIADMNTADFGWLTFEYDGKRNEELTLTHLNANYPEVWVSLDRVADRRPNGRPGERRSSLAKLENVDVKADLTRYGRTGAVGQSQQRTLNGHYVVVETLTPLANVGSLPLSIDPGVQEIKVFDEQGTPVTALRDHVGARSMSVENKYWNSVVYLLFPEALKAGTSRKLRFEYDYETANYAPGGSWYPTVPETFEPHTGKLELTVNKHNEVRSMGKMVSESESDRGKTSVWTIDKPAKMLTFSTAERFDEQKVEVAGIPTVYTFTPTFALGAGSKAHNVAADVANSLQFFQNMLDDKLGGERFYVTSIAAGHGQAFDGFLHLSDSTFASEHPGASELFRAHEVAHEWFGHRVGWKSYRDQWLSESFAEYASMMFVEATVKGGPGFMNEMLDSYEGVIKGNLAGGFSKFSRPWLIDFSSAHRARLGPIGVGYRAGTSEMPAGYLIQTYYKGPLVLHMLRTMLRYKTKSDETFVKILRDYVHDYAGKEASTEDFQRVVEKDAPGNWDFFFNDWIYNTELPTYAWNYRVEPDPKGYKLTVNVKRSGVPDDFVMPVPVRVDFDGGKVGYFFVVPKAAETTSTQVLAAEPRKVTFAPEHSVLANIKKD